MTKLPSFQFYPGDWRKDPNLCRCTKAEKGVWIDLLCLMFECEDRGVLSTGGEPWSDEDIAAAVGGDHSEVLSCLRELLRKGVAHRNQSGAIFSRRLVRDEKLRQQKILAGQKGGSKTQAERKQRLKRTGKQNSSPSSSTSSSIPPNPPGGGPGVFEKVSKADLESPAKLREWIARNIPPPVSEDLQLKIFACAIYARREGRSPPGLFRKLLEAGYGKGDWQGKWGYTQEDYQAASHGRKD